MPECRGSASPAWSVHENIKIGSSCHFCTTEIDAGELAGKREIPVRRGDTYHDICYKTLVVASTLMVEAVRAYSDGTLDSPYDKGAFLEPTIVSGLSHLSRTATEEIFGPVVTIHN